MKYTLLIYLDEKAWAAKASTEEPKAIAEHGALMADLKRCGKYVACDALESTAASTTVRVRDGKTLTTDGPFAETKEHLVGFYVVEADDVHDALAIAARIPAARDGSIEVRPVRMIDV
jgi:hypothetical protein